jgi:profilin
LDGKADRVQLTAAEMSAIAASFNDKSETKAVIANGVKVNGDKYMTIESTDDSLKAKKVRIHSAARK